MGTVSSTPQGMNYFDMATSRAGSALFILILIVIACLAAPVSGEQDYFSYQRFERTYDASRLQQLAAEKHIKLDAVHRALRSFSEALACLDGQKSAEAARLLKGAIRSWPEFPQAHFVLAGIYAASGDKQAMVAQYKMYLSLLQRMDLDRLGITEAILKSIGWFDFQMYDIEYAKINQRLKEKGFSQDLNYIQTVGEQPAALDVLFKHPSVVSIMGILIVAVILMGLFGADIVGEQVTTTLLVATVFFIAVFVAWYIFKMTANRSWLMVAYFLYPAAGAVWCGDRLIRAYSRRRKVPKAGSWICGHCGFENSDIFHQCSRCSHPRP